MFFLETMRKDESYNNLQQDESRRQPLWQTRPNRRHNNNSSCDLNQRMAPLGPYDTKIKKVVLKKEG